MQKLFGRWTRLREVWTVGPCSATPSPLWTSCRQRAPSFANNYRPAPIPPLEQLEGSVTNALNPEEAYNMVPRRDPENV